MFDLLSALRSGLQLSNDRIVGGYETTIEQHPWQVSLQFASSHRCGGSIIERNWILSAAHCTVYVKSKATLFSHQNYSILISLFVCSGISSNTLSVRVGSSKHTNNGSIIKLKNYVIHPKYNGLRLDYDFSLLELEDAIEFNDKVQPITLPNQDLKIPDGTMCEISGWGEWNKENMNSSCVIMNIVNETGSTKNSYESGESLRAAMIPIVSQRYCNRQYRGMITTRMICAGFKEGGKDS